MHNTFEKKPHSDRTMHKHPKQGRRRHKTAFGHPKTADERPKTAFALLEDTSTGRVLVVKETKTEKWMLPGGGVGTRTKPYENAFQAACREMREESGYRKETHTWAHPHTLTPSQ